MNRDVMLGSKNMNMRTPKDLYLAIQKETGARFALDAAAMKGHELARRGIGPGQKRADCLTDEPWAEPGTHVFFNPPYGRKLKKFIERACREAKRGVNVWILIPARTDTAWWNVAVKWAASVYFIAGRVVFNDESGKPLTDDKGRICAAPFPSAVLHLRRNGELNTTVGTSTQRVVWGWVPVERRKKKRG